MAVVWGFDQLAKNCVRSTLASVRWSALIPSRQRRSYFLSTVIKVEVKMLLNEFSYLILKVEKGGKKKA